MPTEGYRSITLRQEKVDELETIRLDQGLRSWPEVIDYLIEKELKR